MRTHALRVDVDNDNRLLPEIQAEIYSLDEGTEVIQVVISACNTQALIIYKKKE